jgi:hypothetical protein
MSGPSLGKRANTKPALPRSSRKSERSPTGILTSTRTLAEPSNSLSACFLYFLESSYEKKASILKLLASNYIIAEGPSRLNWLANDDEIRNRHALQLRLGHPRRKEPGLLR